MTQTLVHTLVKDCMARPVTTIGPYDTLALAYELMLGRHIRHLPVLDNGKLTGIITLTDLLTIRQPDPTHRQSLEDVARDLARLSVGPIMTPDPVRVYDNDTVGYAAELMLERKIGALPVIDLEGHLVGLITESNLFELLARHWREDNARLSGAHPS
jgi:acetoin utilization protein AcuB